jgi:beta-glucanase (GH16 family)
MLLACCPVLWFGCGGGSSDAPKIAPTNLTFEKTVSTDNSGKVTFTAKADNAVKYFIYPGEETDESPVVSESGTVDYTYSFSGTYSARVIAYSADNLTTDKSTSVSVTRVAVEVWRDDFDGTTLNSDYWTHETGNNNGWGNNELESYQAANTTVADGYLTITAAHPGGYTSSRIKTAGKKEFRYGEIEIYAKLPQGQGIWPALWMLGSDIGTVGWPACGEIDIMEMVGGTSGSPGSDSKVYGTVHWSNSSNNWTYVGGNTSLSSGKFSDDFHKFQLVWTNKSVTWKLDDVQYYSKDTTPSEMSEFRSSFFFIFNVAVGGNWPGNPDGTTTFPQTMVVDYISIKQ